MNKKKELEVIDLELVNGGTLNSNDNSFEENIMNCISQMDDNYIWPTNVG